MWRMQHVRRLMAVACMSLLTISHHATTLQAPQTKANRHFPLRLYVRNEPASENCGSGASTQAAAADPGFMEQRKHFAAQVRPEL